MNIAKRIEVQRKSRELGYCVCQLNAPCPCPFFINKKICHCAGEEHSETQKEWEEYNLNNK